MLRKGNWLSRSPMRTGKRRLRAGRCIRIMSFKLAVYHHSVEINSVAVDVVGRIETKSFGINTNSMKRRFLKKSQVLREGYIKGLRQAQRIINEMLEGDDEISLGNHLVVAAQRGDIGKCE